MASSETTFSLNLCLSKQCIKCIKDKKDAWTSQRSSSNSSPVQKSCSQELLLGFGPELTKVFALPLVSKQQLPAVVSAPYPALNTWLWGSLTTSSTEQLLLGSLEARSWVPATYFLNSKPEPGGRLLPACPEHLQSPAAVVLSSPTPLLPSCSAVVTVAVFSLELSDDERNFPHLDGLVQAVGGCVFFSGTTDSQTTGITLPPEPASPLCPSGTAKDFLYCKKGENLIINAAQKY